jgi:predicted O-methyltransferase YrrM
MLAPTVYRIGTTHIEEMRPSIRFVNKTLGRPLVGVEIGVNEGTHAFAMLKTLPIKKLYLIDPYMPYLEDGNYITSDGVAKKAIEKLKEFGDKACFIFKTSEDAVAEIPDVVDFVYVDGNHDYSCVKKDIELYFRKLRAGGIICGHDYSSNWDGVIKAVNEFTESNSLALHTEGVDWWMVKQEEPVLTLTTFGVPWLTETAP